MVSKFTRIDDIWWKLDLEKTDLNSNIFHYSKTDKSARVFEDYQYEIVIDKVKDIFLIKKKKIDKNMVTDCFSTNTFDPKNSNKKDVESILFSFDLIIRTSILTKTSHYNSYQYKLYRLIKFLKEERGIGYRRISHILTEKGYRSIRTNSILKNNFIHSIYKNGKIRERRIERDFESKIGNIKSIFKFSRWIF